MNAFTLRDLLIQKTSALYDIESEILKSLPKLARAAKNKALKLGFLAHFKETQKQVKRLKEIFGLLKVKPKKLKSDAIRGLSRDADWVIKNVPEKARDANLIRAAQYVEHYEIAGYRGAIAWAKELGEKKVAALLKKNLKEEERTDKKLSLVSLLVDRKLLLSRGRPQ